ARGQDPLGVGAHDRDLRLRPRLGGVVDLGAFDRDDLLLEVEIEHDEVDALMSVDGSRMGARVRSGLVDRAQQGPGARLHEGELAASGPADRSEEHTSELQSRFDLVCRLLLEKKKNKQSGNTTT